MENLKNQEGRAMTETPPEKKQEKSKDPVRKETKPLTPEEVRRRRKMLVYPLFFLVFIGAMWLIFTPSGNGEELQEGFNVDVPMPQDKGLPTDKREDVCHQNIISVYRINNNNWILFLYETYTNC